MHIPKTGGGSIELQYDLAGHSQDTAKGWGNFDHELKCKHPKVKSGSGRVFNCALGAPYNATCNVWHIPPRADPLLWQSYSRCDVFCVVRHPVARLISEWGWQKYKKLAANNSCSVKNFAAWLADVLRNYEEANAVNDCHLIPQARYISAPNGVSTCQHVIKTENLTAGFWALSRDFGMPIKEIKTGTHRLGRCDMKLPDSLLNRIREVYAEDYQAFGYDDRAYVRNESEP